MPPASRLKPTIDSLIAELEPSLRPIARRLQALVGRAAPDLVPTVKWGVPVWVGRKNVLCLMLYPDHINLGFFQGAKLSPKHPEIEGTGKGLRHVKVRTVGEADGPVLRTLVREAVALDRSD